MIVQIEPSFLYDSAVLRTSPLTGSDNMVYAVSLHSPKCSASPRTSHTPKTLSEIKGRNIINEKRYWDLHNQKNVEGNQYGKYY
jgi:hypothetical protein